MQTVSIFEGIKYRAELRRLKQSQQNLSNKYRKADEKTKTRDSDDELSAIGQEQEELDNWLLYLQTEYYLGICKTLGIQKPDTKKDTQYYFQFNFDDNHGERNILTEVGFKHVRDQIRYEKKERLEIVVLWFGLIFGLIGSLTGLIAVIK